VLVGEEELNDPSARTVVLAADPLTVAQGLAAGRRLLVPNARAAKAVRGRSAVGLSLHGRAVRTVAKGGVRVAGAMARLHALRGAVAEVLAPADVEGTARRVEPVVSEILRAGIASRPWLVETLDASGVGRRSVQVARLALAYSRRLAQRSEVDPAELLWRAAAAEPARETVLVSGYSRLGEGEVAFLDALAAPGSAVVLPRGFASSRAAAAQLASRGWTVKEDDRVGDGPGPRLAAGFTAAMGDTAGVETGPRPPAPTRVSSDGEVQRVTAHRLPNEEDEVRFALARVKALLGEGVDAARIVLVARDERAYGPLVRAVAAEFGVPVRLAYALPLRETRFGEAVALLVESVAGGLPFEATARLLRHPLTRALPEEAWAAARATHPEGAAEWLGAGVAAAKLLDWPWQATWDEYRSALEAAFEGLGLAAHASERDKRARARLQRALREALPPTGSAAAAERVSRVRFLAALRDVLDATVMPADPPRRGAVELHTPLAVFGARYEHVIALGLTEGGFPQAVGDDPVVDFRERRALETAGVALEDARGAAEREELSFLAVLHACSGSLTLTCPETFGGKERLPSSFFAALGREPEPAGPRPPASRLESLLASLPVAGGRARDAWEVERRREGSLAPDAYDGVHGVPLPLTGPYSASQLLVFGQCSFRWFLQYGLRLRLPDEAEVEVSALTTGSVLHGTLERAVKRAMDEVRECGDEPGSDPFRAAVLEHLEPAYDEAAAEAQRRVRSLTWPLQRGDDLRKLRRLVMSPDFALPGARVLAVEERFETEWRGLKVKGVVDRVDEVEDGLVFTDYKTGAAKPKGAKSPSGKLDLDVQLPLYVEAMAPEHYPGQPVKEARYLSINAAKVTMSSVPGQIDGAALEDLVARFRRALSSGSFPVDPDEEMSVCEYCEFDAVCRRGPRLSRKRATNGSEEVAL